MSDLRKPESLHNAASISFPLLYGELAPWWPLLSDPADYAEEAAFYRETLMDACHQTPVTLLELGSGGGNNASHLKQWIQMTLVDVSERMLGVSKQLNPECAHVQGDMRTVRLHKQFDCVFIHDAICYMTSREDLRRAIKTAFDHCKVGGAALFAPDHTRDTFRSSTRHGGHDGAHRALRYLEWTWDPDPQDDTYTVDYAYLLRDERGAIRVMNDRHVEGLFAREEWLRQLRHVGFEPYAVPFDHSELPSEQLTVFVGRKLDPNQRQT